MYATSITPKTNRLRLTRYACLLITVITLMSYSYPTQAQEPLITVWQTDLPGTSEDTQITIPVRPGTINLSVIWESLDTDATETLIFLGDEPVTINFPAAGTYRVKINGTFTGFYFNGGGDKDKIIDIEQWGDITWTQAAYAFRGCSNLTMTATDAPDFYNVTNAAGMFMDAPLFDGDVTQWDVSHVTDMNFMFSNATSFHGDVSDWDVSHVTNLSGMFSGATAFAGDVSSWNVANAENLSYLFANATSFNGDLGSWQLTAATNLERMLENATSFNQSLGAWDLSTVTNMTAMLYKTSLTVANYEATLQGWATLSAPETAIPTGMNPTPYNLAYCEESNRNSLINTYGWTFTGDARYCTPTLTTIGNQQVNEDETLTFTVAAEDPLAHPITYTLDAASASLGMTLGETLGGTDGTFSWTPTNDQTGDHTVTITIANDYLETAETFTITVVAMNDAPTLEPLADWTLEEGEVVSFTAVAADIDSPTLTYTLDDASVSKGMTIDATTGAFVWTATHEATGENTITVTVSDGALTASQVFTITVIGKPLVTANETFYITQGTTQAITKDYLQVLDPNTDPANVVYTITEAPAHGEIFRSGRTLGVTSIFTQADIDAEILMYINDGYAQYTDGFACYAEDPEGHLTDVIRFAIAIDVITAAENPIDETIRLYPLPAHETVTLKITNAYRGPVTMHWVDLTGKEVYVGTWDKTAETFTNTMDVAALPKGLFVAKVVVGDVVKVVKVPRGTE